MSNPNSRLYLSPPCMGGTELGYIHQAFDDNYIAPTGPCLNAFEQQLSEYTKIPFCTCVSSGTAALHLALHVFGVTAGDRVYSPTMTFIGGVSPILYQQATPVFLDIDPQSWTLSPQKLQIALEEDARKNQLPKVVITTDLYGHPSDYDAILELTRHYGIKLIADCAEALGSRYQTHSTGYDADATFFSFNGNKLITTSSGGALLSHDEAFIAHAKKLATQAREDEAYYQHKELGYNYRMSNVLAAIGLGQMEVLDSHVNACRQRQLQYSQFFSKYPGLHMMQETNKVTSNFWLSVLTLDPTHYSHSIDDIVAYMDSHNIEVRHVWKPMHLQPLFAKAEYLGGDVAQHYFNHSLCLPSGPYMTEKDITRVCNMLYDFLSS